MSDLDRAVDARIDAHRPDHVPPYDTIQARRARRNRTRAAGGAVLSAVAVAGIAFGATTLSGDGPDRLPAYAGPASGQPDVSRASFRPLTGNDGSVRLNTALVEGVLGGDPETGCLWLSDTRGREGRVPLIVLSDSAVADFSTAPFAIRNHGQITATEGQILAFTGGYAPDAFDGAVPGCPATGLPFAGAFTGEGQEQASADAGASAGADAYLGPWSGPDGTPAERGQGQDRTYEITSRRMPSHCDWNQAVVLQIPWPLGSTYVIGPDPVPVREYIRDPDDVLPEGRGAFRSDLDLDATLPQGAQPTGYRLDDVELWFGPDKGAEHVYLVRPDRVERWPRAFEDILCW